MFKLEIPVDIPADIIIKKMVDELSYDDIIDFVIKLDDKVADWDLTSLLYLHFKRLMKDYHEKKKLDTF